jgi:hypothetical protein
MDRSSSRQRAIDLLLVQCGEDQDAAASLLDAEDTAIRRMVAASAKAPVEFLIQLSFDEDPEVRRAVLLNPNTPQRTKERLKASIKGGNSDAFR